MGFANLVGGFGFGFALFSLVMGFLWLIAAFHVTGRGPTGELGVGAYLNLVCAIAPGILLWGLLFPTFTKVTGSLGAIILSSAVFGIAARCYPQTVTLWTATAAGLEVSVLAVSFAATRRLRLPIGIYAGWNFAEGYIFAMPVPGAAQNWVQSRDS